MVARQRVGWCDTAIFVTEVTIGAERWLRTVEKTNRFAQNIGKFARLRPEGLPPHTHCSPVLCRRLLARHQGRAT
jgi:hypothetical protein